MKKANTIPRKHGYQARAAALSRWLDLHIRTDAVETYKTSIGERLTVSLSRSQSQFYWITDRGRSRVIKH